MTIILQTLHLPICIVVINLSFHSIDIYLRINPNIVLIFNIVRCLSSCEPWSLISCAVSVAAWTPF